MMARCESPSARGYLDGTPKGVCWEKGIPERVEEEERDEAGEEREEESAGVCEGGEGELMLGSLYACE